MYMDWILRKLSFTYTEKGYILQMVNGKFWRCEKEHIPIKSISSRLKEKL
jgi:hypothetical protein